jgi:hypothetical protein
MVEAESKAKIMVSSSERLMGYAATFARLARLATVARLHPVAFWRRETKRAPLTGSERGLGDAGRQCGLASISIRPPTFDAGMTMARQQRFEKVGTQTQLTNQATGTLS